MEVIAIASTVCALCKGIQAWIDQHAEKDAMLSQLLSSIIQIHNILLPFTTAKFQGTGELQLADCISSIGDLLQRTKKHLRIWDYKRTQKIVAYLNPTAVIKQLKEDATAINNHLIILLTSLAVVGYFRDHHTKDTANATSASNIAPISKSTQPVGPLHQLVDPGAREFWSDYVGAKVHQTCLTQSIHSLILTYLLRSISSQKTSSASVSSCGQMVHSPNPYAIAL